MKTVLLGLVGVLLACGSGDSNAGGDAGGDATSSGPDATTDAMTDGGVNDVAADVGQGSMSFISTATCNPSPCQSGASPNASAITTYPTPPSCPTGPISGTTNVIGVGAINDGTTTSCRIYEYYRPKNLVGKATAVFTAGGAGAACTGNASFDGSNWYKVADANRLVIILVSYCPSNAWSHPAIDVPIGSLASDGPYLKAVIQDAAANPSIDIDTSRMILTGGSSGGSLTWGIACDPTYSTLFQGYAPVSAAMDVDVDGGLPVPGTERCASASKSFFITNVHGTADKAVPYAGVCIASHCITSFAETERFWGGYLGCGATPARTMFGTPDAANIQDDFSGCGFGLPPDQYEAVTVTNGGHQREGLDAVSGNPTNGFDTAQTNWAFFSTRHW
jgi:poly(3-hydroxybutyrate) depolymerase